MKILFFPLIRQDNIHTTYVSDYLTDSLFHGLRTLLGNDVVDLYKMWHLYDDADPELIKGLEGESFATYGLLVDSEDIDRENIQDKVINSYYDYIIVSIHHTVNGNYPVIESALETFRNYYPKDKLIFIDGWDEPALSERVAKECVYFKKEMLAKYKNLVQPISLSIPEEKIQNPLKKTLDFAPSDILHEKISDSYRKSFFAHTSKAKGWDRMRHYEILACGCVPFFDDLERCPDYTLRRFPVKMCSEIKNLSGVHLEESEKQGYIDFDKFETTLYNDINEKLISYTKKHLTTVGTAKNFLSRVA